MAAYYEDPSETRGGQATADVRHERCDDLRPDRDGTGEGTSDLRQTIGKQRRYEALDTLSFQLAGRTFAELAGRGVVRPYREVRAVRLRRADRQQGQVRAGGEPFDLRIGHPLHVIERAHTRESYPRFDPACPVSTFNGSTQGPTAWYLPREL